MDLPELSTGVKPHQFTLDDQSTDYYMMGSEAGAYMGLFRGAIYKKFPKLWRRVATAEERKRMYLVLKNPKMKVATNVTLVRAIDIVNIVLGNDKEYRATFTSLIEKMEAKQIRDSQLNVKVGHYWPTSSIHIDIDESSPLVLNDFNIFSLPICHLTMVKKVLLSMKKRKCLSIFLDWKYSKNLYNKLDTIKDELIPIRLYIRKEPYHLLNDVFFWNKSTEVLLDYYTFAELLCDDYDLPLEVFGPTIVHTIKHQVERYQNDNRLIEIYKNSQQTISNKLAMITIDITINEIRLQDNFQWNIIDHCDPKLCVEFGEIMVKDLKLSPEFIGPICVCTYGQILWHRHLRYIKSVSSFLEQESKTAYQKQSPNLLKDSNIKKSLTNDYGNHGNHNEGISTPKITKINGSTLEVHKNYIDKQLMRIESCTSHYAQN